MSEDEDEKEEQKPKVAPKVSKPVVKTVTEHLKKSKVISVKSKEKELAKTGNMGNNACFVIV